MKSILTTWLLTGLLIVTIAMAATAQTTPAPATAPDSTSLSAYAGAYTFESGSPVQKFTVSSEKGELYGEADGYGKNKLVKQTKADTYQSTSSYGSMITFERDANKAVTGLILSAQGTTIAAKKDK